jgi:hypothetical protein
VSLSPVFVFLSRPVSPARTWCLAIGFRPIAPVPQKFPQFVSSVHNPSIYGTIIVNQSPETSGRHYRILFGAAAQSAAHCRQRGQKEHP